MMLMLWAGVSGDEGWEVDWEGGVGFAVGWRMGC